MSEHLSERTDRIRQLNDQFRQRLLGSGKVLFNGALAQDDSDHRAKVHEAVRKFVAFDTGNDPYGEHDFGSFELDGDRYMFKIDYYSLDEMHASEHPENPNVTLRVMTVFYASDY